MIEMDVHVRMTLGRFDHNRVEGGTANRVDVFVRVALVRRKM